jgi:hypothetical protein
MLRLRRKSLVANRFLPDYHGNSNDQVCRSLTGNADFMVISDANLICCIRN